MASILLLAIIINKCGVDECSFMININNNKNNNNDDDNDNLWHKMYRWCSLDVTATMLVRRTKENKISWEFSIITQKMSHNLLLFCAPTWPSYQIIEYHLYVSLQFYRKNIQFIGIKENSIIISLKRSTY